MNMNMNVTMNIDIDMDIEVDRDVDMDMAMNTDMSIDMDMAMDLFKHVQEKLLRLFSRKTKRVESDQFKKKKNQRSSVKLAL
jgi:hypothetical protein